MARVRFPGGEALGDESVGDALDALAGEAHQARDVGHGARLVERAAEHLPAGDRQPARRRHPVACLLEAAVEAKDEQHELRERGASVALRRQAVSGIYAAAVADISA